METVRIIHDREGGTLTIWFGEPSSEAASGETEDGVIVMKDEAGRVIGVEVLSFLGNPRAVALELSEARPVASATTG